MSVCVCVDVQKKDLDRGHLNTSDIDKWLTQRK